MALQGFGGDNGPAIDAQLNDPRGVAVSGSGDVFISELGNDRVRRVDAEGDDYDICWSWRFFS